MISYYFFLLLPSNVFFFRLFSFWFWFYHILLYSNYYFLFVVLDKTEWTEIFSSISRSFSCIISLNYKTEWYSKKESEREWNWNKIKYNFSIENNFVVDMNYNFISRNLILWSIECDRTWIILKKDDVFFLFYFPKIKLSIIEPSARASYSIYLLCSFISFWFSFSFELILFRFPFDNFKLKRSFKNTLVWLGLLMDRWQ